jgi:predicted amino acid dehydrogenase
MSKQALPLGILINIGDRTDAAKYHALLGYIPLYISERLFLKRGEAILLSKVSHIETQGMELPAWVIGSTLTPRLLRQLPFEVTRDRIVEAIRMAKRQGAQVAVLTGQLGGGSLGARVISHCHSDAVPDLHDMTLTTGNGYTVAVIVEAIELAAHQRGVDLSTSKVAVVGGYGSIGRAVLQQFASHVPTRELMVVGNREPEAKQVARQLERKGAVATIHTDFSQLNQADVLISVTNATHPIIMPDHVKQNAIVCDAAAPRDVSPEVREKRPDAFVFRGGIVEFPSKTKANLGYDVRLGDTNLAYACFAEGAILAFSGEREMATESNLINPAKVSRLHELGKELCFKVTLKQ